MSEVKAQGAPGRIWVDAKANGKISQCDPVRLEPWFDGGIESMRADIARELAEALRNFENDDGHTPKAIWEARNEALAKWREATEQES